MIVERRTYVPKPGRTGDLVEMIKEGHEILDYSPRFRILSPIAGPFGVVVHEIEYEDLAERQKFFADLGASEKWPGFVERYFKVVESGGSGEFWLVRQA